MVADCDDGEADPGGTAASGLARDLALPVPVDPAAFGGMLDVGSGKENGPVPQNPDILPGGAPVAGPA